MGYVKEDRRWRYYDAPPPGFSVRHEGLYRQRKDGSSGCGLGCLIIIASVLIVAGLAWYFFLANLLWTLYQALQKYVGS